jgi:hexokinase
VESGNYDLSVGKIDELFFQTTKDPSIYHFEKMISGAYLGAFSRIVIEKAIEEGVLSKAFGQKYKEIEPINTTRMSNYLEMPLHEEYDLVRCITNEKDGHALHLILDSIIRRAAKLTAINLSAAVLSTQGGINPRHPVLINADGTTFYKTEKLEFYTRMYLDQFLTKQHHRYYNIVHIDNSPIIGAAVAPLV